MTEANQTTLKLITAPNVEPISLADARDHLRLVATGSPLSHPDDTIVTALILAARQLLDGKAGILGRQLITATWELSLDRFPENEIKIPLPPLQSIVSVKYDDVNGTEQTVSAANYVVDARSEPGWVVPVESFSWPDTMNTINAVRVRFTAGYGNAATNIPEPLIVAMKLLLAHWYQHRTPVIVGASAQDLPLSVEALISPYRIWEFP